MCGMEETQGVVRFDRAKMFRSTAINSGIVVGIISSPSRLSTTLNGVLAEVYRGKLTDKSKRDWNDTKPLKLTARGCNHLNSSSSASHLICFSKKDLITSNSLLILFVYFAVIK